MKHLMLKSAVLASAILLGACSSTPVTTAMLDQARGDFVAANNNPQVSSYAPLEFKQASDALDAANAAAAKKESLDTVDRLAYIAKQKEPKRAYEDLVWALMNTKEFLFNH